MWKNAGFDKYASRSVTNFEIYDNNGVIARIESVKEDFIQINGDGTFILGITDVLIDKTLLDYFINNPRFEGYIKGETEWVDANSGWDHKVNIDMPKVKLINYKIKNNCEKGTGIDILFEIINNNTNKTIDFQTSKIE